MSNKGKSFTLKQFIFGPHARIMFRFLSTPRVERPMNLSFREMGMNSFIFYGAQTLIFGPCLLQRYLTVTEVARELTENTTKSLPLHVGETKNLHVGETSLQKLTRYVLHTACLSNAQRLIH